MEPKNPSKVKALRLQGSSILDDRDLSHNGGLDKGLHRARVKFRGWPGASLEPRVGTRLELCTGFPNELLSVLERTVIGRGNGASPLHVLLDSPTGDRSSWMFSQKAWFVRLQGCFLTRGRHGHDVGIRLEFVRPAFSTLIPKTKQHSQVRSLAGRPTVAGSDPAGFILDSPLNLSEFQVPVLRLQRSATSQHLSEALGLCNVTACPKRA